VSEALVEHHVLEYPGGYTRSVGPVIGRFLTALRDGRLEGVRIADGRVLVPPTEYDPVTGAEVGEWVEVGPTGRVRSWTWVARPDPDLHPLGHPFAFALVQPEGADTAMLHVVDAGSPDAMAIGMLVGPRYRAERVGSVRDLEAWVPLADGEHVAVVPPLAVPEGGEAPTGPVGGIVSRVRLEYDINAGEAPSRFLHGLEQRRILGEHSRTSDEVYVPPRGSDAKTGLPTEIEVEVGPRGTVTTFCVVNIPGLSELAPEVPYVCAQVLLDGAHTPLFALLGECDAGDVRMGMRVEAVWADEVGPDQRSIRWFRPTGEPDADPSTFEAYL